ncbi:MAG TPA: G1 family glutamic endopeptidase [Streptosporangiaceae bacterium]|nr:G1 family glutamic endopeptidase [Streptosporangiaceae bacterium]
MAGTASAATTRHANITAVRPGAAVHGFRPGGLVHLIGSRHAGRNGKDTEAESTNWSGYAATGADGAFSSVSATWTQPTATCTKSQDQYAAFWVGLDGYSSDSVEQTGTDSDCDGKTPDYYGWYEMYPADPVYYTNTVKPGDSLSASVTFTGTDTYTLTLTDSTQDWTQTQVIDETGLDRSSAEVITEAPCCTNSGGILPLSDFGTVTYGSSTANGTSLGSQSPTEIIMVDNSGRDKDSTSAIGSGGGFSNTWIRSS